MAIMRSPERSSSIPATFPAADGYPRAGHARIVVVPERRCIAIDGEGEPGGPVFQEAMSALYGTAYGLHF